MTASRGASAASGSPGPPSIKALDLDGLRRLMAESGEPRYRATQVCRWLYQRRAKSFTEMTDLPATLRDRLAGSFALPFPQVMERQVSQDGTRKYLLDLGDGVAVETVGLPAGERLTVCFSTQAGCAMGCAFCATGQEGLARNLAPGEIVDQLSVVAADFGRRITNAVAMGQGEPFANYDAVLEALRIVNHPDGLGLGARHITVSTCGLLPGIRRFSEEPEQFTLAVSLHSAVQQTRDRLMPAVAKMRLPDLQDAIAEYADKTGRRVSLEYALIAGVNDTDAELEELVAFCIGMLVHVNLIPANPVGPVGQAFERAATERVRAFERRLASAGVPVSIRAERGTDIDAACGQLRQRTAKERVGE